MAVNKTTSAGLSNQSKEFYDKRLLNRLLANLPFLKFGQKRPIPKRGGKTIEFRKFNSLALAKTPLTEGEPPASQDLVSTSLKATIEQYGGIVKVTDLLDLTSIDPIITETVQLLGEQWGETFDVLVQEVLLGTTSIYNVGGGLGVNDITAANILTANEVLKVRTVLKRSNVKPLDDGYYVMFCAPEQMADLMRDPLWRDVSTYNNSGSQIEKGEVGRIYGFKFIDTTLVEPVENSGGVSVFSSIAIGKDAFGIVDVNGGVKPTTYIKIPTDGDNDRSDPLNQYSTIGWKGLFTTVRLQDLAIIRVNSAATTVA